MPDVDREPMEATVELDQTIATKADQAAFAKSMGPNELSDPDRLIEVVKVEPEDFGNPMIFRLDRKGAWHGIFEAVQMLCENSEPGSRIILTVDRMRIGDYAFLPEHQGW